MTEVVWAWSCRLIYNISVELCSREKTCFTTKMVLLGQWVGVCNSPSPPLTNIVHFGLLRNTDSLTVLKRVY